MGNCVKRETGFEFEDETPEPQKIKYFNYNYRVAPKIKEEFMLIESNNFIEKPEIRKYSKFTKSFVSIENNDENIDRKNNKLINSERIFPDNFRKKDDKNYIRGDDHNNSFIL